MRSLRIMFAFLTFGAVLAFGSVSARADAATAQTMVPILRTMYNVEGAEIILSNKTAALNSLRKNKASAQEIANAKAAVTDAKNLLNTLNGLISRDITIIQKAPASVVNPPSFATNSLAARGAWNDYVYKEKTNHTLVFPSSRVPTSAELNLASQPFSMY